MNQEKTENISQNSSKTGWKIGLAVCILAAMFLATAALSKQNILWNSIGAILFAAAAVFCGKKSKAEKHRPFTTRQIAFIGMMSAIVFVSNYISFQIPLAIGGDVTRIHVANSFCLLAGLSLGPVAGGLASGIGSMLYDFTVPQFIAGSPFTFAFKFAMSYVAGKMLCKQSGKLPVSKIVTAGILGQLTYIVLYIGKKFITYQFFYQEPLNVTLAACGTSLLSSLINAVIAVIIASLLAPVFRRATQHAKSY